MFISTRVKLFKIITIYDNNVTSTTRTTICLKLVTLVRPVEKSDAKKNSMEKVWRTCVALVCSWLLVKYMDDVSSWMVTGSDVFEDVVGVSDVSFR